MCYNAEAWDGREHVVFIFDYDGEVDEVSCDDDNLCIDDLCQNEG